MFTGKKVQDTSKRALYVGKKLNQKVHRAFPACYLGVVIETKQNETNRLDNTQTAFLSM